MLQYEAANNGLGISEMINTLISRTWKAPKASGMEKLIQLQTEQILLTYLLAASIDNNNSFGVRSIFAKTLKDLKAYIEAQAKTATDDTYKGHLALALERMNNPADAKPTIHKAIPPGAPIGCDWD